MKLLLPILILLTTLSAQNLELPKSSKVIHYEGFSLEYSEKHEQAKWVAYELTAKEIGHKRKRTDNFRHDPKIKTGSATKADYKGSGYDRGHLCPAGDLKWSQKAISELFLIG